MLSKEKNQIKHNSGLVLRQRLGHVPCADEVEILCPPAHRMREKNFEHFRLLYTYLIFPTTVVQWDILDFYLANEKTESER